MMDRGGLKWELDSKVIKDMLERIFKCNQQESKDTQDSKEENNLEQLD